MKIIIAGDGKVGLTLTRKLSAEGHDITLIDSNPSVLEASMERYDVMAVQGNCVTVDVLEQAEVKKADLLIAATSADEINLLCCMTAHALNNNLHTIARIRNPEYDNQIYTMRNLFALSLTVNPERQAAREIERIIKYPGFIRRETFAKGRIEIVELRIDKGSKLDGVSLMELNSIVKCKVLVCAVKREGKVEIPKGGYELKEGDKILVTAPTDELTVMLKNLGIITHKVKKVILCGGGRVAYYLAERLSKSGIAVHLIEKDRERCEELANKLPNVSVINGDASSQSLLESEGLTDCHALVSMTGLDELNMVISLYGKKRNIQHVITKVGHTGNNDIMDSLALDSIICPKELCCDTIVRYIRAVKNTTGAALTVHAIAGGKAEALEFRVDEKTMNCGIPLKELKLKENVLITCITHGRVTIIPNGDSCINVGDTVIVVVAGDKIIEQLNDIFL